MILTALPSHIIITGMGHDEWSEEKHPRDAQGRFGAGGSSVERHISEHLFSKSGETVSKSSIVKHLTQNGHEIKSNDPRIVRAVENHNSEHAVSANPLQTYAERKAASKAAHEASRTPEQLKARAERQAEQVRNHVEGERAKSQALATAKEQAAHSPMNEHFSEQQRESIQHALENGDLHGADDLGALATVGAISRQAQTEGWTLRHISKEGNEETSRYLVHPNGAEIRVSNHQVPETAQRESQRGEGKGARWVAQMIVRSDWRKSTLASYMGELRELANLSGD